MNTRCTVFVLVHYRLFRDTGHVQADTTEHKVLQPGILLSSDALSSSGDARPGTTAFTSYSAYKGIIGGVISTICTQTDDPNQLLVQWMQWMQCR